jgi:hypothetical protein
MKTLLPTEDQIQMAFMEYVQHMHPDHFPLLFHVPNEGKRGLAGGVRQKRLGLKPGIPDLMFAMPKHIVNEYEPNKYIRTIHHGLFLEVKSQKGKLTKAQASMQNLLELEGYYVDTCYNLDELINIFEWYIQ